MRDRDDRRERKRAGSTQRDAKHRARGEWTTLAIPDGVELFQPKAGTYRLDIIPFEAGDGNPFANKGEWYWERTYFTHRGVGPNNESYVCPAKTSKRPCPICEHRAQLAKDPDGDEEQVKMLKPKERQLFLVRIRGGDDEGQVKLFESSYHTFGRLLDLKRQDAEDEEDFVREFDDPKAGASLKCSWQEKDAGGYTFLECYSIEFKPRKDGLEEEILEHGICLDSLVKVPDYDRLKQVYLQEESVGDDDQDAPAEWPAEKRKERTTTTPISSHAKPSGPKGPAAEMGLEEGQMVRARKFGRCEIVRISSDGTSLILRDEDGEEHRAVDPKDVRPFEGEERKPEKEAESAKAETGKKAPTGGGTKVGGKGSTKSRSEDEDDWDEPSPAKQPPKKVEKEDDDWDEPSEPEQKPEGKAVKGKASKLEKEDDDWD